MKVTRIPAQITTVEDTIAGGFTLTQILLFLMPLFFLVFAYAVLPEKLQFSLYKIPLIICFSLIFLTLAIRIKGTIVLHWIVLLLKYSLRPKYYVYNKNSLAFREVETVLPEEKGVTACSTTSSLHNPLHDLHEILNSSQRPTRIHIKKGGVEVVSG